MPCKFYDLTFDNPENQIILWCAHKLLQETRKIESESDREIYVVKQLREQCRESSRGVAKDALPMLQGLGIINDLYHGPVKKPDNLSRARTETTKIRDENL
ncbi:hypothetical protein HZB97_02350 [Candidatus Gottesmanbacteria bacterium]|nr:hypothetical protein [Candidatus Gottesmanbacteria bacterium]